MSVYVIADLEVIDAAGFDEYRRGVPATIVAHGGRYLARGGATRVLEGTWSPKRCVVLEFPTMQQFDTWWNSPEYQPLRALRERTTRSHLIVTEGV